jgi:hypothetical protein
VAARAGSSTASAVTSTAVVSKIRVIAISIAIGVLRGSLN